MKTHIFIIILLLSGFTALAQKQELNIGIGTLSHPTFKEDGFWPGLNDAEDHMHWFGPVHISYNYYLILNWDIGIAAVYEYQKHDITVIIPDAFGKHHIYQQTLLTFLLHTHYHWLQKGIFDLYSGGEAGLSMNRKKDIRNDFTITKSEASQTNFAYQVTPLGLRIGRKLGGYLELGYGYKGLISAGISYRF